MYEFFDFRNLKFPSFDTFCKLNLNSFDRADWNFRKKYGNVDFETAYELYLSEMMFKARCNERIEEFKNFLISGGYPVSYSHLSNSVYFTYNSIKYRFSDHAHPLGSLSYTTTIDLYTDFDQILFVDF
jgi:hypothetical protein